MPKDATPDQVCRAALVTVGVDRKKVERMRVGRLMDAWVQLAVMEHWPTDQVEAEIERRWPELSLLMDKPENT